MNKIEQRYEFRLANRDDVDDIMAFYKREWHPDHILANDREFFCYQHAVGDRVNFMLAIDRESQAIHGAEGFIQYSKPLCDIGAVMWRVSAECKTPFLGVEVVKQLKQATGCRTYMGPGANPRTAVPLHKQALKHLVGTLDHYYMLGNPDTFRVAQIRKRNPGSHKLQPNNWSLQRIDDLEQLKCRFDFNAWRDRKPFKDQWYVNRRYFQHPIYPYHCYAVNHGNQDTHALLIGREVQHDGATVLRIVDLIGDPTTLGQLEYELTQLIARHDYEYIDFYCFGMDAKVMKAAGLVRNKSDSPNVIPNYFEPYVAQNVDIWYSLSHEDALIFKADGDQDRPNSRPVEHAQAS